MILPYSTQVIVIIITRYTNGLNWTKEIFCRINKSRKLCFQGIAICSKHVLSFYNFSDYEFRRSEFRSLRKMIYIIFLRTRQNRQNNTYKHKSYEHKNLIEVSKFFKVIKKKKHLSLQNNPDVTLFETKKRCLHNGKHLKAIKSARDF